MQKYRENLNESSNNVTLLSPDGTKNPYYAFHGWAGMKGLDEGETPNSSTIWTLKSGSILTENSPILNV